jgi:two-component system LytT family response regulator
MRAVIIDDELKSREVLSTLINSFIDGVEIVGGEGDIINGVKIIKETKPDLVFLDISLKDGDSFAILDKLSNIQFKIIFITAFDEYATQAIDFTRIPCLNKPIDIDELETAIQKVRNTEIIVVREDVGVILNILNSNFSILPVIDVFKVTFVDAVKILYLSPKGNETLMTLKNEEEIISWYPFKKYMQLLKNHNFAQTDKNHLIYLGNINRYPKIGDKTIHLIDNVELHLSEEYQTDFIKRYAGYREIN